MEKDFTGKATSRVCRVTYRIEDSVPMLDLDVEFAWTDVSTAHDKRDQRMRDHFGKSGFPTIRGSARGMPLPALRNAGPDQPVTIPITLVLGGVSNQVHGLVTNQMSRVGELDLLDVAFNVSQEKFGFEPITLLGFMSVRDEVAVQARFSLPPDPGAPPPPADR